jgi:O-antigen ligase
MSSLQESNLYRVWLVIGAVYDESLLHRIAAAIGRWFGRQFRGSVILGAICREGVVARSWDSSFLFRILTFLVNLPLQLLNSLYRRFQNAFDESVFFGWFFEMGAETAIAESWFVMLLWAIPFTYWNNAYSFIGFILLLLLFCLRGMHERNARLDIKNVGFYPVLLFGAVCLSVVTSAYPSLSTRFLLYHVICLLYVLITVSAVRHTDDLKRLVAGGAFAVMVSSVYGVYQRIQGVKVNTSYVDVTVNEGMPGRVESYFDNPNTFAEVLILLLPLVLALILTAKHWLPRLIACGIFVIGIVALGMTYSRASWIGMAVAIVVFVCLWKPRLLPALIVLCLICIPFIPSTIWNRLLTITNTSDSSTASRVPLYQAALAVIRKSPISGAGLGTAAVQEYISENNLYHASAPFVHAHNIYLEVWIESGILGFLGFCGSLFWNIKNTARTVNRSASSAARTITASCAASLCGAMVCGLADYLWNYPRVMSIFWFVFAMAIAGTKICRAGCAQKASGSPA